MTPKAQVLLSGSLGWNTSLAAQFGLERWKELKKALKKEPVQLGYYPPPNITSQIATLHLTPEDLSEGLRRAGVKESGLPNCYLLPENALCDDTSLMYFLDGASIVAALLLDFSPGDKVLDLCSAPGGKALIVSSRLFDCRTDRPPLLVCNEVSPSRLHRLKKNLGQRIPTDVLKNGYIQFTDKTEDLERLGPFDRILVDAPCSTDRHLIKDSIALARWSTKSVKRNAERQVDLLCRAVDLLRDNGKASLIYSTCALSDIENDGVIRRLLKKLKYKNIVDIIPPEELLAKCKKTISTFEIKWIDGRETNRSLIKTTVISHTAFSNTMEEEVDIVDKPCPTLAQPDLDTSPSYRVLTLPAERTQYGMIFLPDVSPYGPLFLCGVRRTG